MNRDLNFFKDTILASHDTLRCCLHDDPVSFDWCEKNCSEQSSCDTYAWAGDEVMLLEHEAWLCPNCENNVNEIIQCQDKCDSCGFAKTSVRLVSGQGWSYYVGERK